jgi:hypothetical protein
MPGEPLERDVYVLLALAGDAVHAHLTVANGLQGARGGRAQKEGGPRGKGVATEGLRGGQGEHTGWRSVGRAEGMATACSRAAVFKADAWAWVQGSPGCWPTRRACC